MPGGDRPALHPLLSARWSPTGFDPHAEVGPAEAATLLEAARWAPSAGNSQPWSFVVGHRGDQVHRRLVRHLLGGAARWAPDAGLLVANLSHQRVAGTDWAYSEFSSYDLGQAVAHLTVQAAHLGLAVRQFRSFDRDGLAQEFGVPEHWEVTTLAAVGRAADPGPDGDRARRGATDLHWSPERAD